MSEENEIYSLTVKGLLGEKQYDKLMLYMYKLNVNAIILDEGELTFNVVHKGGRG